MFIYGLIAGTFVGANISLVIYSLIVASNRN